MVVKPKTQAERLEAARAEVAAKLDWQAQMEMAHAAERAEREKEQNDFALRVQQRRDAVARGVIPEPPVIPTITGIYAQKQAEQEAEVERLEAARIAALSPLDLWKSALPFAERQRVATWEAINHQPWPFVGSQLALDAVEA